MKIEYDNNKILELLNDFSHCTNLTASFQFNEIDSSEYVPKSVTNAPDNPNSFDSADSNANLHFCRFVQSKCTNGACHAEDSYYLHLAKKERRTIIYSCHAGLCESITPVFLNNYIIGFIMCGKFIDEEHVYSTMEKVKKAAKKYNLDEEKLLALYEKLPVISKKHWTSAMRILQLCITYILDKHFINVKDFALIEDIRNFIIENLSKQLTVELLCSHFFINRQKLNSLFRKRFQDSVKHFIIMQRLEQAKILLSTTNDSIEEISESVGFSNYNYFIRIFHEKTDISPLKYRKQNQEI